MVQVGRQGMADRYTYLPLVGLFVILAWGGPELCARLGKRRPLRAVLGAAREISDGMELSDATFAVLQAELSAEHIVDLTLIIAIYCGVVRLLGALEVDVEASYEPELNKFPLD